MGEQQHSLTPGPHSERRLNPSWAEVTANTVRLWLERHNPGGGRRPSARRQRGVLVLSAVAAMALGALVTLAFTATGDQAASARPSNAAQNTPSALQVAAANRALAANWIADQVLPGAIIGCDPQMCAALEAAKVSAARLEQLQLTTSDPLDSTVIVATPAVRNQFGPRLATVYAPLVLARFGSGPTEVDVRYVVPDGTAAFEASLASARGARVAAGEQLLANKNVQVTTSARQALLAGNVDPRLLVTLSLLAHEMTIRLVAFDDASPGASSAVPLRGAEIGASASAGLSAMLAFLAAQQAQYQPSSYGEATLGGRPVVTVQFDAPGPLGLGGS
ncbi:MAG: hypothetical protein ACRDOB_08840 [Streptosporangiaceae bacterium]